MNEALQSQRLLLSRVGGLAAALVTLALAIARLALDPQGKVGPVLLVTALGFGLLAALTVRFKTPVNLFPLVGIAGVSAMALAEGGLRSEAIPWLVAIPLISVALAGERGAAAYSALALLAIGFLFIHDRRLDEVDVQHLALRAGGIGGALTFALLLAVFFQRERSEAVRNAALAADRLRSVADALPDIIFSWDLEAQRMRYLSPAGLMALGHDAGDDPHAIALRVAPEENFEKMQQTFANVPLGHSGQGLHRLHAMDGSVRAYESRFRRISPTEVLGVARDVSRTLEVHEAVKRSAERLSSVVAKMSHGVAINDESGRLVVLNDPLREMFGVRIDSDSVVGKDTWDVIYGAANPPADLKAFRRRIREVLTRNEPVTHEEIEMKNGRILERAFTPLQEGREVRGHLWTYHDVTERVLQERAARLIAERDMLTGSDTRAAFQARADTAVAAGRSFWVLFVDLDGFKKVNDTLGHAAGDTVLRVVAERLRACVRTPDRVGRLGGDEFAVLIEGELELPTIERITRSILAALAAPIPVHAQVAQIGGSIGVAAFPRCGPTSADVLHAADEAMYAAKRADKNGYRVSDPSMAVAASA